MVVPVAEPSIAPPIPQPASGTIGLGNGKHHHRHGERGRLRGALILPGKGNRHLGPPDPAVFPGLIT